MAPATTLGSRLDAALDAALAENRLVGAVVMVAKDGEVAYARAAGLADREANAPMRTNSIMRYASLTKPIVSAAALGRIEDGVLGLDDPVTRFLPAFTPK